MPRYEVICRLRDTNDHYLRRIEADDLFRLYEICAGESLLPVTIVSVDGVEKGVGGQLLSNATRPAEIEIEFPGPKYWKLVIRASWRDAGSGEEHTQRFEFDRSCGSWRSGTPTTRERIAARLCVSTDYLEAIEETLRAIAAHEEATPVGRA